MRKKYIFPAVLSVELYPCSVLMTSGVAVQEVGFTTSNDGDKQEKARAPKF